MTAQAHQICACGHMGLDHRPECAWLRCDCEDFKENSAATNGDTWGEGDRSFEPRYRYPDGRDALTGLYIDDCEAPKEK